MKSCYRKLLCAAVLLAFAVTGAAAAGVDSPQKKEPSIIEATDTNGNTIPVGENAEGMDYLVLTTFRNKDTIGNQEREDHFTEGVYTLDNAIAKELLTPYLSEGMDYKNVTQYAIMYLHEKYHTNTVPMPVNLTVQTTLKQSDWVQVLAYYDVMPGLKSNEPRIVLLSSFTPSGGVGRWERIESSMGADGRLSFQAKQLAPYIIVTYSVQEQPGATTPTGGTVPHSPQTGISENPMGMVTAALLIAVFSCIMILRRRRVQ